MKIFLIGIGGIGMQGLAQLYYEKGYQVAGSDMADFPERKALEEKGIKIYIGHDEKHIDRDLDLVIYSAAIPSNNPELKKAYSLKLKVLRRSEALGELMKDKVGIAVAGTHGKTTTATMISQMLEGADFSPTVVIGAEVKSIRGCARLGQGKFMVAEACEYDRSFLDLKPQIAVITNIEPDHLDYYKNLEEIRDAFGDFIKRLPPDGLVVAFGDDPSVREVVDKLRPALFYGEDVKNDLVLRLGVLEGGKNHFSLKASDSSLAIDTFIRTPGKHIALDAAAAAAVAWQLGIAPAVIKKALENLGGIRRRFEIIQPGPLTIIDDYGHHPTEISQTLDAAKKLFLGRRLIVVFQPHQFSRTKFLLKDFGKSFGEADLVIVAPIWAVRDKEEDKRSVTTQDLVTEINRFSHNARLGSNFKEIKDFLKKEAKPGDVIITLGAAKTNILAQELKQVLSQ